MKLGILLAATDASPIGNEALRTAARLANEARGSVAVVTVARDPWECIESWEVEKYRFSGRDPIASVLTPRVRERLEPTIRAALGRQSASHLVRVGVPAVEIPRAAETANADLLVLGRGLEMGRTIEGTVRRAEVPAWSYPPVSNALSASSPQSTSARTRRMCSTQLWRSPRPKATTSSRFTWSRRPQPQRLLCSPTKRCVTWMRCLRHCTPPGTVLRRPSPPAWPRAT